MNDKEELLTKAKLLEGSNAVETYQTEMGSFKIRPLTTGEKAKSEAIVARGLTAKGKSGARAGEMLMEGEGEQLVSNQSNVGFYIVARGLSVGKENYSPEEVKGITFKGDSFEKLLARIEKISDLKSAEEKVREFFRNEERPDDGSVDNEGSVEPS